MLYNNYAAPEGSPTELRSISNSVNLTSITIVWKPVTCIQQNGVIKEYNIYYRKSTHATDRSTFYSSTPVTNVTILGLNPNTKYLVSVTAVSQNNLTSPSAQLNESTEVPSGIGKQVTCTYLFA